MQNIRNLAHTVQGKIQEVTEKVSEKVSGHPHGMKEGQQPSSTMGGGPQTGQTTGQTGYQQSSTTSSSSQQQQQPSLSNVNVEHNTMEKKFFIRTPNNPDCYLEYTMMNETIHGKNCVDLAFIFVPNDLRHMGYGSKLAIEFLNWCRQSNYCVHVNPQVRPFFVETVLNTNEFKNSGWKWNANDSIVEPFGSTSMGMSSTTGTETATSAGSSMGMGSTSGTDSAYPRTM